MAAGFDVTAQSRVADIPSMANPVPPTDKATVGGTERFKKCNLLVEGSNKRAILWRLSED